MIRAGLLISSFLLTLTSVLAQPYSADWASLDKRPVPGWFKDAKFGIFIHWGLYSVPAWATKSNADGFGSGYSEWYWQRLFAKNLKIHPEFVAFHEKNYGHTFQYQEFAAQFKAELFNPDQWATVFKQSGAKYIVLTSKHHEGFTLWPNQQAWNWNAQDTGPHRDLAGDLAKAVREKGLRMGYYYSLFEWFNPQYKTNVEGYVRERMIPQIKDLVTRYQPDILWTDGEWDHPAKTWHSEEILAWLYNESPSRNSIVVNDRWGNDTKGKHGSFYTSEYGQGEQSDNHPWEECRGIGESFGYNRNEDLADYQTSAALIHQLVSTVSRGGNFLLNIGPTADGRIPVIMQQRLKDIGDWLTINGEAIYGTERWQQAPASSTAKDAAVRYTRKGNDLYAICLTWPDQLVIQGVKAGAVVSMPGFKGAIKAISTAAGLRINAPAVTPATIPCQHAWVFKIQKAL